MKNSTYNAIEDLFEGFCSINDIPESEEERFKEQLRVTIQEEERKHVEFWILAGLIAIAIVLFVAVMIG